MIPSPATRRNAIAFDAFCLSCETRGLQVTVGLSGVRPSENPPNDLVIRVVGDGVSLSERVDRSMPATIALLEQQIGMRPR